MKYKSRFCNSGLGYDIRATSYDIAAAVASIWLQQITGTRLDLVVPVAIDIGEFLAAEVAQQRATAGIGRHVLESRCSGATHRNLGNLQRSEREFSLNL